MSAPREPGSAVEVLEQIAHSVLRQAWGFPGPAQQVRDAAEQASPEFIRLWDAGRKPKVEIDVVRGKVVLRILDGGKSDAS